jgi:biopolymer transport protein ExbD
MSWSVRHQGSPKAVENLTLAQIVEGLQDGLWEVTDEVKGPDDDAWVPIEMHPQLEEVVADIEPPPPPHQEDETRLDMTPLIDVCMVLLIFFILTITQATLVKQLEAANLGPQGIKVIKQGQAEATMVYLKVTMENGAPVIRLGDKVIAEQDLEAELYRAVAATKKTDLLLDCDSDVREKIVVEIQDAAKGAGIQRVNVAVPKNLVPK